MIGNIVAGTFSAGVPPVITSFESIATVTVGAGGQATIDFTSIPSTYKHLQMRLLLRGTATGTAGNYVGIRFNNDTGSNYASHQLRGDGATADAAAFANQTTGYLQRMANGADAANIFGALVVDILDYGSTSKNKTIRNLGGWDSNGSGQIFLNSNLWFNGTIAAITSIKLTPESGNFAQYTHAALYGIKD